VGRPLSWEESLPYLNYVREHGVEQFLHTWRALKDLTKSDIKWGEELEYGIFKVDHTARTVKLSIRGQEIMSILAQKEAEQDDRIDGCR
jgi:glutamate--cysteine ligase catalytic subunit